MNGILLGADILLLWEVSGTNRKKTDKHTVIATYRLNQARGWLGDKPMFCTNLLHGPFNFVITM